MYDEKNMLRAHHNHHLHTNIYYWTKLGCSSLRDFGVVLLFDLEFYLSNLFYFLMQTFIVQSETEILIEEQFRICLRNKI